MSPNVFSLIGLFVNLNVKEDKAEVHYATAGLNNRLFVSRYMLQLPTEKELKEFIKKDIKKLHRW